MDEGIVDMITDDLILSKMPRNLKRIAVNNEDDQKQ